MDPTLSDFFAHAERLYKSLEDVSDLEAELTALLPELRRQAEPHRLAHTLMCLATRRLFSGDAEVANRWIAEGLAVVDIVAHPRTYLGLLNLRGVAHQYGHDTVGAFEVYAVMLRVATDRDVPIYVLAATENLAYSFLELGDWRGALDLLRGTEALAKGQGDTWEARWRVVMHAALVHGRRLDEAEVHAARLDVLLADPEVADPRCRSLLHINRCDARLHRDIAPDIARQLDEALQHRQEEPSCGLPETQARIRWLRARACLLSGETGAAVHHATRGLVEVGSRPFDTLASQLLQTRANAHRQRGDVDTAWRDLNASAERGRARFGSKVGQALRDLVDRLHAELDHLRNVELQNINQALREANISLDVARRASESARRRTEADSDRRSRFLASMSHEIRTPLNSLSATVDLLAGAPLDETQHRYLEVIRTSADLTLAIVNDVLDLDRLEQGHMQVRCEALRIPHIVDGTLALLRARADSRGVALHTHYADNLPEQVIGDTRRLQQLLMNLVGNAIKFAPQAPVEVRVDWRAPDAVRFEVHDRGKGIPTEHKAHIFDAYERGTRSDPDGSGLGLAISDQIVQALGGQLGVSDRPGGGSLFWFELPMPACCEVCVDDESAQLVDLADLHVLLAEDDLVNQLITQEVVERLGARQLKVVDNGIDALEQLATGAFDLALLDVHLPGLGGLEVTQRLRAQGVATPLLAVTASTLPEHRTAAFAAGVDGFLCKPVGTHALARAIAAALSDRS